MHTRRPTVRLSWNIAAFSAGLVGCGLDWTSPERDRDAALSGGDGASAEQQSMQDAAVADSAVDASPLDAAMTASDADAEDALLDAMPGASDAELPSTLSAARVLLLHLDETQFGISPNEVRDQSGLGNHGTIQGTGLTAGAGRFGTALALSGSGWVEVADAPTLRASAALTVSAWFWLDVLPGARWPGIVAKRTAFQLESAFAIFLSPDNQVVVDIDGEESRFFSHATVRTGRWHHVALTFDGNLPAAQRAKLYIDGALDTTATEPSASIPPYPSALQVGNLPNGGETFIGRIDEVAMWTRVLDARELSEIARNAQP